MIDINKPVEKGHDMVLNNSDGTQELGTAEEFTKRKEAGDLSGVHTNVEPAENDERLSDEQDNPAAEERTEGEVEQTEEVRDEADEKQDEPVE